MRRKDRKKNPVLIINVKLTYIPIGSSGINRCKRMCCIVEPLSCLNNVRYKGEGSKVLGKRRKRREVRCVNAWVRDEPDMLWSFHSTCMQTQ